MESVYKRKLSDTERMWLGANLAYPPFANQFILEGKGTIDFERLVQAVKEASSVNPGSRLVLKGFLNWCHWVDSGITPRVRKIEDCQWDGRSCDGAYFLLAKSAWKYQDGRFRIAVPVDLRPRIAGLRSTGNLSNTIYCKITKDSTPESVGKNTRVQLENKNDCVNFDRGFNLGLVPLWLIAVVSKIILRRVMKKGLFAIPVCISNVGFVDAEKLSCEGFMADSIFVIPLNGDGQPAFIVVSGMSGKIEIAVGIPNMICDNGRLDLLMEDLKTAF